jgi:RIO-like serine/threonine protein kinase
MSNDNLVIQAKNFGHSRGILIEFGNPLGIGQEGIVWKTNRETAIKVFDRIGNFDPV